MIVRETEVIWSPGRLAFPSEKMVPKLSQTVCIEKLIESLSIILSGMVGVSWHIVDGMSWHIYIQPTNLF